MISTFELSGNVFRILISERSSLKAKKFIIFIKEWYHQSRMVTLCWGKLIRYYRINPLVKLRCKEEFKVSLSRYLSTVHKSLHRMVMSKLWYLFERFKWRWPFHKVRLSERKFSVQLFVYSIFFKLFKYIVFVYINIYMFEKSLKGSTFWTVMTSI